MKKLKRVLSSILAAAFMLSASTLVQADEDAEYRQQLAQAGFPEDYIEPLLALHKEHPDWIFEANNITELSKAQNKENAYTWDYVIYMETEDNVKRSLVYNNDANIVLRDFSDDNLYDSGWYKASISTVEYYMDPRNFLNEKQIFQFHNLGWDVAITLKMVEASLNGTFMANAKLDDKYSNMTYAEYFYMIGEELGANPVYLAARVRAEQGTAGTSALISGKCGDKLWEYYSGKVTGVDAGGHLIAAPTSGHSEASLKRYNGYYNYYNIGSSGTGYFQIYIGGMTEAMTGTADMAAQWGGSGSWNTRWKAIYGGAAKCVGNYINDYQNTGYFQKFNVDARSKRNFWGQYMQDINGSMNMGDQIYNSYNNNNMLDGAYKFIIPVYDGMPENKCTRPNGTELSDRRHITDDKVQSYVKLDMSKYLKQDGMQKSISANKITWRVYRGSKDSSLNLGRLNLSEYDYALIEYSNVEGFDRNECGVTSVIGFISDPEQPYGGGGDEVNLAADLAHRSMVDTKEDSNPNAKSDYLTRKVAKVNLDDVSYIGDVYLCAYTQPGQRYLVHNVLLVTRTDHTGTIEDTETAAPETEAPAEETDPAVPDTNAPSGAGAVTDVETTSEDGGLSDGAMIAIIAVAAVVILAVALFVINLVMKKKNTAVPQEQKDETHVG